MDILINMEQIIIYGIVILICIIVVYSYLYREKKKSEETKKKISIAKEEGLYEPISLHPYIDLNKCIGSAACINDCPEKDILGIVNGKATVINTSNCIGHGACFHSCPVEAISLRIGTETRGVELPHVNKNFETNMKGVFIAGELGGMGLIKNSVEQGQQAVENIVKKINHTQRDTLDLIIIGAGPAGISASLTAKKEGLSSVTLEQDSLGGTVYTFPRSKIVMTAPMNLPLYGKVKLYNTSKDELLQLWSSVIEKNNLKIYENTKVERITPHENNTYKVITNDQRIFISKNVLLAIGRRGTPRKLNIPGEDLQKVAYRLLEPERIRGKKIIVVGGGDSAVESAMLLMQNNEVILSYRKEQFARIKPKNKEKINKAIESESIEVIFNSNLKNIEKKFVTVSVNGHDEEKKINNDLVYIFAGGELPNNFLKNTGVEITRRFGYIIKEHQ